MLEIELASLDFRYEGHRMRVRSVESRLLSEISERGIVEPVEGVDIDGARVLLNGFKRCRCARKLGIGLVPYCSLGADEAAGIMSLLREANNRGLSILEQARFIKELHDRHGMDTARIAGALSRSKSWVSMRTGLMREMSERVRQKLFSGAFPVYPYMYTLRRFMRMNGVLKREVDEFVVAVSGKGLSVRDIEQLASGYFRGPSEFGEQIRAGNVTLPLARMREVPAPEDGCGEFERVLLKDFEIIHKYMRRVMGKSLDKRLTHRAFCAQAHLLSAGILSLAPAFIQATRDLHDKCGQA